MRPKIGPRNALVALLVGVTLIMPWHDRASHAASIHLSGVVADAVDPYFITIECGGTAEAKKLGVNLKWGGTASTAVGDETSVLNTMLATKPNGIILAPFSNTAFVAPVQRMMRQGIPIADVDGPLVKNVAYQSFYTINVVAGKALAKPLGRALHGKGTVGILTYGAGDIVQDDRWKGLKQELHALYPKIKVLTPQYVGVDTNKAASTTSAMILANPHLSAIFTTEGPAGTGAASALLAAHKKGKIKLYSFDAEPVEVQGLKNGTYQGLVAQSPYKEGVLAVKSLVKYLRHGKSGPVHPATPYHIATPVKVLTKANVNKKSSKPFLYRGTCTG